MSPDDSFNSVSSSSAAPRWRARFAVGLTALALVAAGCTTGDPAGSPAATGATGATDAAQTDAAQTDAAQTEPAGVEGYPDGPITFVVPFSAGGPTDTVTRLVAEPMAEELGAEIVIQNVTGAGGTVAAGEVANAEPDGQTVLMHHIGMSTAPTLYPDLPYDPLEDFEQIGLVTEVPMTIIGSPNFEPDTLEELITYVEENIDTVTYANAGIGAASQLCGLLIEEATGLDLTEVPYEGTGPAMDDLLGDQVDFMCDQTTNTTEPILAGRVKAYAVTSEERIESLPDVPTTEEAGLGDVQVTVWHGLYVPAGTPEEIVNELNRALKAALQDQTVIDRFAELGTEPVAQDRATPEAHREHLQSQLDLWRPIIEEAGVTAG